MLLSREMERYQMTIIRFGYRFTFITTSFPPHCASDFTSLCVRFLLPRVPDSFLYKVYHPQLSFDGSLTLKCIQRRSDIVNRDDIPNSDPIYLGSILQDTAELMLGTCANLPLSRGVRRLKFTLRSNQLSAR